MCCARTVRTVSAVPSLNHSNRYETASSQLRTSYCLLKGTSSNNRTTDSLASGSITDLKSYRHWLVTSRYWQRCLSSHFYPATCTRTPLRCTKAQPSSSNSPKKSCRKRELEAVISALRVDNGVRRQDTEAFRDTSMLQDIWQSMVLCHTNESNISNI